jgi:5-methylcytosine-specific restriction endonuclease McrA
MCLVVGTYADNKPKARILDTDYSLLTWNDWSKMTPKDDEDVVHGVSQNWRIPEIILLSRYKNLPQQKVKFSRRSIYKRDNNQCQYCGARPGTLELSIDHLIPKSAGGIGDWNNMLLACIQCNRDKADRVPTSTTVIEVDKDGKEHSFPAFIVYFNGKRFPGGSVTVKRPARPKYTLWKSDYRCKSWDAFISEAFWNIPLATDIKV